MSEQKRTTSRNKKLLVGGIAAGVALLAISYAIDFPTSGKDTVGTVVPAQRVIAQQNGDVKLGNAAQGSGTPGAINTDAANRAPNQVVNSAAATQAANAANNAGNGSANGPFSCTRSHSAC